MIGFFILYGYGRAGGGMTIFKGESTMDQQRKQELYAQVSGLCESKAEEFALLGYDNVKAEDIWECVCSGYKEIPPMYRLVNDILSLKVTKYMNWLMVQMYRNS
jgi:hypothetical protein